MSQQARVERDSLGPVEIPAGRLWGPQTERARQHFAVSPQSFRWPRTVIRALGVVKKCAALANAGLAELDATRAQLIVRAAQEVIDGVWDEEFPVGVFQSGSGTQTNMNANEVIASRAEQLEDSEPSLRSLQIHPNDHVNRGQSTNDVFPAVMHLATAEQFETALLPALTRLRQTLAAKSDAYHDVVMVGRTHLQDAAPVALGQVISGWAAQLDLAIDSLTGCLCALYELPLGGTAVGTGLNAHPCFGDECIRLIAEETGLPFIPARNRFAALSAHDAMVNFSGALRTLAGASMKIANDVRWYASGPRAGIGELVLPVNEPGSSIMPGKINPTQCELVTQAAVQVFGNDHAVAFAGSQGNFQLNAFKPIILHNVLQSTTVLAESIRLFEEFCAAGMEPNLACIDEHLRNSLMLATALNPHIGYEKAAAIALRAHRENLSLRDAAIQSGDVTAEQFQEWIQPGRMI